MLITSCFMSTFFYEYLWLPWRLFENQELPHLLSYQLSAATVSIFPDLWNGHVNHCLARDAVSIPGMHSSVISKPKAASSRPYGDTKTKKGWDLFPRHIDLVLRCYRLLKS